MMSNGKGSHLVLPDDVRGIPAGSAYRPYLRAGYANTLGTSESIPGIKTGRGHELLSQHEVRVFYQLHFNPRVIDIREQYPAFSTELLHRMAADPSYVPRKSEVPTFDFVLTIGDQHGRPYRTVALNIKEAEELSKPAVLRRFLRDRKFCQELGWDWYVMTERDTNQVVAKNARRLYEWIVRAEMASATAEAFRAADWITANNNRKYDLNSLLERCSVKLEMPRESMTHIFALACYLGCIVPEMSRPIELMRPLEFAAH
jgi:hypothetical protein